MLQFPTIFDWIERLSFLQGLPAAGLVLITALIVVLVPDWRVAILALAVQYLAAGLLFVDVLDPRLAIVKLFVGWFICLILYFTVRQVSWGRLADDAIQDEAAQSQEDQTLDFGRYLLSGNRPFRVFLSLMMALVVLTLAQRPGYRLPAVSEPMNLAIFALGGLGLLGLSTTTEPLKAGLGLLMFMTGFELFYHSLEQSVAMLAFLAGGNLVLALTMAYLIQTDHASPALFQEKG